MDPDSQYENYMLNKGPISAASEVLREGAAQVWGRGSSGTLRARVLSGSMIMLVSSGLVGAMNLVYNLAIAHGLGAAGFGHASAGYTVLMLLSSLSRPGLCSSSHLAFGAASCRECTTSPISPETLCWRSLSSSEGPCCSLNSALVLLA